MESPRGLGGAVWQHHNRLLRVHPTFDVFEDHRHEGTAALALQDLVQDLLAPSHTSTEGAVVRVMETPEVVQVQPEVPDGRGYIALPSLLGVDELSIIPARIELIPDAPRQHDHRWPCGRRLIEVH